MSQQVESPTTTKLTHEMTVEDVERIAQSVDGVVETNPYWKVYYRATREGAPVKDKPVAIKLSNLGQYTELHFAGSPLEVISTPGIHLQLTNCDNMGLHNTAVVISEAGVSFVKRPNQLERGGILTYVSIRPKEIAIRIALMDGGVDANILRAAEMVEEAYKAKGL